MTSDPLTGHFSWEEMTRTDHAEYQEMNRRQAEAFRPQILVMAQLLERIRDWTGPILVHSGFRCPELNGSIKGDAPKSQHMLGQAADISRCGEQTPESVNRLFEDSRAFLKKLNIPVGQLIRERIGKGTPGWVHISLGFPWRPRGRCGEVLTMADGVFTMVDSIG